MSYRLLGGVVILGLSSLSQCLAAEGPSYAPEQIRGMSVAGLHLGMLQSDAADALKKGEFEGGFKPFDGNSTNTQFWVKVDQKIAPFRFLTRDKDVKLWAINFTQSFDKAQSQEALKSKIIEKYGVPTSAQSDGTNGDIILEYHIRYSVDPSQAALCEPYEWRSMYGCDSKDQPIYLRERVAPKLTIHITAKQLKADLDDRETENNERAFMDQQKQAMEKARQEKNSKSTEIGL